MRDARNAAIGYELGQGLWEVLNGRPLADVIVDHGTKALTIGIVATIVASSADRQYAMARARTYRGRTAAQYVAVRTQSSRSASKPKVILINKSTNQPANDREYELESSPSQGQRVMIDDYDAEYLR